MIAAQVYYSETGDKERHYPENALSVSAPHFRITREIKGQIKIEIHRDRSRCEPSRRYDGFAEIELIASNHDARRLALAILAGTEALAEAELEFGRDRDPKLGVVMRPKSTPE